MSKFSVVQNSLDPIDRDAMRRAFERLDFLTPNDVAGISRHAFGVLIDRMDRDRAEAVCRALGEEEIDCCVVEADKFFALPGSQHVRRMDVSGEGLVIYDTLDRPGTVAWDRVEMVAAGYVRDISFKRERAEDIPKSGTHMFTGATSSILTTEAKSTTMRMEVLYRDEGDLAACRVDGQRFNYGYLGDRKGGSVAENFAVVVKDVAGFAVGAKMNRGVRSIVDSSDEVLLYPNLAAYEEELAWWLWQADDGECD